MAEASPNRFTAALEEILGHAQLSDDESASIDVSEPVDKWPPIELVLTRPASVYAKVMNVRVEGEQEDYLLRLPTGIFYAQGVKANVLFFERKPGSETPWTKDLWIYDQRTNQHFTLKQNPLTRADLDDFVACYRPGAIGKREETERFKRFTYDEIVARDKASLDIFWPCDESLEDTDNLPPPGVIAAEIVEDLEAALEEFRALAESLAEVGIDIDNFAEAE